MKTVLEAKRVPGKLWAVEGGPCRGAQRPPLTKGVVDVDEGTPRVDEVDELVLHVELLHPRESQKLNTSMIPKNPTSQE